MYFVIILYLLDLFVLASAILLSLCLFVCFVVLKNSLFTPLTDIGILVEAARQPQFLCSTKTNRKIAINGA